MPKYRVHVCRIAYSHLDIEVEARSSAEAEVAAEQEAGDHVFPSENSSEYKAQGCTKIEEPLTKEQLALLAKKPDETKGFRSFR